MEEPIVHFDDLCKCNMQGIIFTLRPKFFHETVSVGLIKLVLHAIFYISSLSKLNKDFQKSYEIYWKVNHWQILSTNQFLDKII